MKKKTLTRMRLTEVVQNGVEMLEVVAMGCNKACQIWQSELVCGKIKSNYTNSSHEYASITIPFVSESNV